MDTNDSTLSAFNETTQFHIMFEAEVKNMMEPVRETLIEDLVSFTREQIVAQLLMEFIADDGFTGDDPESYFAGKFNLHQKQRLMAIAEHMGPDWAQALYHAAVFITKVA